MLTSARQWLRRNRTPIAVGVSIVGAGYLATQYLLDRINDARERMSSDRIAKENLSRRFKNNQETCSNTVLALLPIATTKLLRIMDTEAITVEIQQIKSGKNATQTDAEGKPSVAPSIADTTLTEDESKSTTNASLQSESGVHASQVALPPDTETPPPPKPKPEVAGGESLRDKKVRLWKELIISSITRTFTLLYTLALLVMFNRVQLNLLGRRSYLSSVVSLASDAGQSTIKLENNDDDRKLDDDKAGIKDFAYNSKYLGLSWWLLDRSVVDLQERVYQAVDAVFEKIHPREVFSVDAFSQLTLKVRKIVEAPDQNGSFVWPSLLLPPRGAEIQVLKTSGIFSGQTQGQTQGEKQSKDNVSSEADDKPLEISPPLRRLIDETSDLFESPAFNHVLSSLLDAGFSFLLNTRLVKDVFRVKKGDKAAIASIPEGETASTAQNETQYVTLQAVQLPKILSFLTREAHEMGGAKLQHGGNLYLEAMDAVGDLKAFAAVVYSSNWENEIQDDGPNQQEQRQEHQQQQQPPLPSPPKYHESEESYADISLTQSTAVGGEGEDSLIVVPAAAAPEEPTLAREPSATFESAWEKATANSGQ